MSVEVRKLVLQATGILIIVASVSFIGYAIISQWQDLVSGSSQIVMEIGVAVVACVVIAAFGVHLIRKAAEKPDSAESHWPPTISS